MGKRDGDRPSRGAVYRDQQVRVGDAAFVKCRFEDCEMVYDGRPTELDHNLFEGCRWRFEGAAANTIALLRTLAAVDPSFAGQIAEALGLRKGRLLS